MNLWGRDGAQLIKVFCLNALACNHSRDKASETYLATEDIVLIFATSFKQREEGG